MRLTDAGQCKTRAATLPPNGECACSIGRDLFTSEYVGTRRSLEDRSPGLGDGMVCLVNDEVVDLELTSRQAKVAAIHMRIGAHVSALGAPRAMIGCELWIDPPDAQHLTTPVEWRMTACHGFASVMSASAKGLTLADANPCE